MGRESSSSCMLSRRLLYAVVLLLALEGTAPAATPAPLPAGRMCVLASAPPLLAFDWHRLLGPLDAVLGNRRRMVQLATVGVCIALYIMLRR